MNRYEILLLTIPEITEDEIGSIERGIEKIAKEVKGSVYLSFDKWGKTKLAYGIGRHEYGHYFLVRCTLEDPKAFFAQVSSLLKVKFNESVIRFLTKKLDALEPTVYQRPEIVEETSTRDVGDFLRKNKMEGLLSSVPGENGDARGERPRYSSFNRRPKRDENSSYKSTDDTEGASA